MKSLSLSDQMFLWLEKRQQPMHVGGLYTFDFPENAGSKFISELADSLRSADQPTAPFNQRLNTRFGQYFWEEDPLFDIDHHFRHSALPKPGRIRELLSLVSVKHSALMDRERPMWEAHLIEGIRGKRFAMYFKIHHCMIDGIAGMRMAMKMLSDDPKATGNPPIWMMDHSRKRPTEIRDQQMDIVSNLINIAGIAKKQISTVPALIKEAANTFNAGEDHVSIFQAPSSILNQPITGSRRFAAQSFPIERFKAIAKKTGSTLNDVVVTVCGSALRNYMISQKALPTKPLISMIPMSIRNDDSDSGNQIAMILANLGTHLSDPGQRLDMVRRSIKEGKERIKGMTKEEAINYTALTMSPAALNSVLGVSDKLLAYNVVISNVPGPDKPMYWNGAKLDGMYPVSIPMDRAALNITLVSYIDQLEFGFTACRRTLPSMQRLLDYVETGIAELEITAGIR